MHVLCSKKTCLFFIYRHLSFDVSPTQFHYVEIKIVILVILFSTSKGDKFLIHSFQRCILKRSAVPSFLKLLNINKNSTRKSINTE